MFSGAHVLIYTTDAEADRRFLRDVLKLPNVDAGDGWLIFALPAAELGVHPHDSSQAHEFSLMCDDIEACRDELARRGVSSAEVQDEGWGLVSSFKLPGGGTIAFYQPRHARPC